ncbi:MAG: hypothetical protein KC940_25435 [Candidatus Omnitrophica bacterium]|nr:hypothetical protein [Candidatus Omnitrophota bacterium]
MSSFDSWAFQPQSNGNGVRWESASAEAWSGSFQTNGSGAVLHAAGASGTSVDTVNGNGVTAYIGLLDPILPGGGDTPTPTETEMGPTMTETPTVTPGGPTFTPTPCVVAMSDEDYDLNGDGFIDAKDLIAFIEIIETGVGNPFDLNCDGFTNEADLIQFSKEWKIELPSGP